MKINQEADEVFVVLALCAGSRTGNGLPVSHRPP